MDSLAWLKRKTKPRQNSPSHQLRMADFSVDVEARHWALGSRKEMGIEIEVALGVDIMPEAESFTDNFDLKDSDFICEDITKHVDGDLNKKRLTKAEKKFKEDFGPIQILVGGPPCQGNSDLNNHSRRDDPRNDLYLRMARAVRIFEPRIVLIENVQTVTRAKTNVVSKTVDYLQKLEYNCRGFTLKASDLGLAQRRVRHFTLAIKDE